MMVSKIGRNLLFWPLKKCTKSSSEYRSKSVDEFTGQTFDYIITVCDNAAENCPIFPGKATRIHQAFEDPPPLHAGSDESRMTVFRRVRDEIREWMGGFIEGVKKGDTFNE